MAQRSKYCLAFVELYNQKLHSMWNVKELEGKYICSYVVEPDEFYSNDYIVLQNNFMIHYNKISNLDNDFISNYKNIIRNCKYYNLNIIEIKEDSFDGSVHPYHTAILKTHYISIIQRKWRKIYNKRQREIKHLKNLKNLIKRSQCGKNN